MPMNIAVVGSKAAGKGTQCGLLAEAFNLDYFSTGMMFQRAIQAKTPLGREAENHVIHGQLVPNDLVNGMVEEWLWTTVPKKGIVFDGFPRTPEQASFLDRAFDDMGRHLDALVYLEVSEKTVASRLEGRRLCRICKDEFHTKEKPFTACPYKKCKGEMILPLPEDKPEVVYSMVQDFTQGLQSLLEYFRKTNRMFRVDANQPVPQVNAAIIERIEGFR